MVKREKRVPKKLQTKDECATGQQNLKIKKFHFGHNRREREAPKKNIFLSLLPELSAQSLLIKTSPVSLSVPLAPRPPSSYIG
jgi:hypothetical protein